MGFLGAFDRLLDKTGHLISDEALLAKVDIKGPFEAHRWHVFGSRRVMRVEVDVDFVELAYFLPSVVQEEEGRVTPVDCGDHKNFHVFCQMLFWHF